MQEYLVSGVELMVVGMGIVFLFLVLLVWTVNLMAWLVQRYFPTPIVENNPASTSQNPASGDGELVAVISAAIQKFRSRR